MHLLNLPRNGPKAKTVEIRNLKFDFNLCFANIPSSITLLFQWQTFKMNIEMDRWKKLVMRTLMARPPSELDWRWVGDSISENGGGADSNACREQEWSVNSLPDRIRQWRGSVAKRLLEQFKETPWSLIRVWRRTIISAKPSVFRSWKPWHSQCQYWFAIGLNGSWTIYFRGNMFLKEQLHGVGQALRACWEYIRSSKQHNTTAKVDICTVVALLINLNSLGPAQRNWQMADISDLLELSGHKHLQSRVLPNYNNCLRKQKASNAKNNYKEATETR
jgi:hypothetical protein